MLLLSVVLFAQGALAIGLTGTKTIPGSYATIQIAIADLNTSGVGAGGVVFNVAAGYTETIAAPLSVTATGTGTGATPANPITFQRSGSGANPVITAYAGGTGTPATAIQDGIWNLVGSDYVTIDGIDLVDPNTTNPATMEYGYGLFKASATNGCQYNTIKNCVVTLSRENWATATAPAVDGSRAINVMNSLVAAQATLVATTTAPGANSYNKFYSNTLQNCNIGIALIGCVGTVTTLYKCDFGNDVGGSSLVTGNSIINYGGGALATTTSAGVRTLAQYDLNVSYNTVNNNNGSGVNHVSILKGIWLNTAVGASATINFNTLSVSRGSITATSVIENASGSNVTGSTINMNNNTINNCNGAVLASGFFYGIYNNNAAPEYLNINNNSFATITHSGTGDVYIIQNLSSSVANVSIRNNTFTDLSLANAGTVRLLNCGSATNLLTVSNNVISGTFTKTVAGGTVSGCFVSGAPTGGTATVTGNNFSNINLTGATIFIGINHYASTTSQTQTITNNAISNITGGTGALTGIYQGGGADGSTLNGNTVSGFTGTGAIMGLSLGNTTAATSLTVYRNRIFNLSSNIAAGTVYGIVVASGVTTNIYNNLISDLKSTLATGADAIRGISITSTTALSSIGLYYNTIYLNAAPGTATFGCTGVYHTYNATATTTALDMRNNIIVNASTPGTSTGMVVAFRRSASTDLNNYVSTSNNNLFYAGTPGAKKLIYHDGTNSDQALAAFQSRVSPREANSVSVDPVFLSTMGSDADYLHINPANLTAAPFINGGGAAIATVTTDYDGNTRDAGTPDIGADEFSMFATVTTGTPATSITSAGAILPGIVNANHESATGTFEYGLTQAYGSTSAWTPSPATGTGNTATGTALSALVPNSTYHYRINAATSGGTIHGADQTFNTLAATASTFTGATSNAWDNYTNWSNGIPGASTDVVIPSGLPSYPTLGSAGTCHNISMAQGASLLDNGYLAVTGTANVDRSITGASQSWHLLSSPVAGQAIQPEFVPFQVPPTTTEDFLAWYGPAGIWVNYKNTTTAPTWNMANGNTDFTPGKGYLVEYEATSPTKHFQGVLNTGTVSYTMTNSGTGAYSAYNLAGNPYPSSIDWKAANGWQRSFLVQNIGGGYDMNIWNDADGQYGTYSSASISDAGTHQVSRYIPVGQGFMVEAASPAGALEMNNSVRVHENPPFLKSSGEISNVLRLRVSGDANPYADEVMIEFGHEMADGGAKKMYGFYETAPSLFTVKPAGNFSIDFRGEPGAITVPLNFKAGAPGKYALVTSQLESFTSSTSIILEDLQAGQTQNLVQHPYYSFAASDNDEEARFLLHFGGTFSMNENQNGKPVSIYAAGNKVYISNLSGKTMKGEVIICNMIGQQVMRRKLSENLVTTINVNTGTGYYLVKTVTTESAYMRKVFIHN